MMLNENLMMLLKELAILFPAFLLIFASRGFFKALIAKIMGDDTAAQEGFLTLNPVVHIDFFGFATMLFGLFFFAILFFGVFPRSLLFIFLILLGMRWSIPVPIEEQNFKNYKLGVILTTLAGPVGNFFLALIIFYLITYFPYQLFPACVFITLIEIFRATAELAIFFCVIDLIPIPPFDAGRLLQFIIPDSRHDIITWLEEYSSYILIALFFIPGISDLFFKFLYVLIVFVKKLLMLLVF